MEAKRFLPFHSWLSCLVLAALLTASCGTILYPERHGQVSGRVDPGVVVMDGVCLFFFLIPGIIAFAVDYPPAPFTTRPAVSKAPIRTPAKNLWSFMRTLKTSPARVSHSSSWSIQAKRSIFLRSPCSSIGSRAGNRSRTCSSRPLPRALWLWMRPIRGTVRYTARPPLLFRARSQSPLARLLS